MSKKALIIGVSGQDGAFLAEFLLKKGYTVVGTSRDALDASKWRLIQLGIQDDVKIVSMMPSEFRSVIQTIDDNKPDEVYNLSGQSSPGLSFQMPVETFDSINVATLNILEAIRFLKADIRFYNAASSEIFGDTGISKADETTRLNPVSPYAVAKAAAYWTVNSYRQAYGMFACSGILFNHESPMRGKSFVTSKIINGVVGILRKKQQKLIMGNLDVQRDWGWAPEYVDAMWRILQTEKPADYIVATGTVYSLRDFLDHAFRSVGLNWEEYVEVDRQFFRPNDPACISGNPLKAQTDLNWKAEYHVPQITQKLIEARLAEI
jgi:GDPmannose 4,6-dehydratase